MEGQETGTQLCQWIEPKIGGRVKSRVNAQQFPGYACAMAALLVFRVFTLED